MRDIDTIPVPSVPADPDIDDAAYGSTEGAGLIAADTTLTDPAFTDTKAYGRPSLGGDFSPGGRAVLGGDADGGAADLAVDTTVVVTAPVAPLPAYALAGRSANNTSFLNLYPWHKTPPEGLDMNNPNPPPSPSPAPPPPPPLHGISMPVLQLVGNDGTVQFSGPAATAATITVHYSIDGGATLMITASVAMGDTGSQIAAKVRNAIDATFGVDADGTGGTVHVVGIGGDLTAFNVTIT